MVLVIEEQIFLATEFETEVRNDMDKFALSRDNDKQRTLMMKNDDEK